MIYLMRPNVSEEEIQAVRQVFESKTLTEGEFTRKFEAKVCEYIGSKHAIATTSCTTALELALRALRVGSGDEVIVPDFTHPATADAVLMVGAKPILVDISEEDFNLDISKVRSHISNETRCIIPVSLFGHPADIDALRELQTKHGFYIVEDAACSLGADVNSRKVGTQADITCFSFHPRKIVATGEGGMLVTENEEWYEQAVSMQHFGIKTVNGKPQFVQPGTNYKMSNILAAIGIVQLSKLEKTIIDRQKKAAIYKEILGREDWIKLPATRSGCRHTYQTYCTRLLGMTVEERDRVIRELKTRQIEVQIGTYALHLQPAFRSLDTDALEVSGKTFSDSLALPLHHELSEADQEYVCENLSLVAKQNS